MSQELFNSLTKEVFTEAKVITYTWKILENKTFQEEHPRLYLCSQMKSFVHAITLSNGKVMKMHAALCLFDFIRRNFEQIKKEMPVLLPIMKAKAKEMMDDTDESCVGCELYDVAQDVITLCTPPHPETPCKCSCSQKVPGAPRKIPHPVELEVEGDVQKELFPSSLNEEEEPKQTKKGDIYRAVSMSGKKSTVVCLEDNGALLELRFGEKTGKALIHHGRWVFDSYEEWQNQLNCF